MDAIGARGTGGAGEARRVRRVAGCGGGGAVVWWGLVLLCAQVASAGEARFGADPTQDLGELTRTGRLAISVELTDDVYRLDASAVLRVDARRLLGASVDYER